MGSCRSGAGLGQYLWKDSASAFLSAWENSCAHGGCECHTSKVGSLGLRHNVPVASGYCALLHAASFLGTSRNDSRLDDLSECIIAVLRSSIACT